MLMGEPATAPSSHLHSARRTCEPRL